MIKKYVILSSRTEDYLQLQMNQPIHVHDPRTGTGQYAGLGTFEQFYVKNDSGKYATGATYYAVMSVWVPE